MRTTFNRTSIIILLLQLVFSPLYSQEVSREDSRQFNLAILNVLDEYERTVTFSENRDRQTFLRLFNNPEIPCIYNDIMGSDNFQKMVSPEAYVASVPDDGSTLLKSVISDVKKEGDIYFSDGLLHRKVSFSKYLMIIDASVYTQGAGGVLFDSAQAFGAEPDFYLLADFAYNPVTGKCSIAQIASKENKTPSPYDEDKFTIVVKSSDKYDKQLKSKGKPVSFNEFDQAVAYYNDVEVDNPDVYTQPIEYASGLRYNVLGLKYKPMYFRFKLYGDMSLGKAYKVATSTPSINNSSNNIQFGADVGFEISMNPKWRTGLYTGVGLSLSKLNLSILNVSYSLDYIKPSRRYNFSATEDLTLMDLMVPVYWENEFSLSRKLVLDVDLGARFYLNHNTKLGPYHVTGEIGNESVQANYTAFKNPTTYSRSVYDIALYANIEADYCIAKRYLYAYVSYGYEYGLSPSFDSGLHPFFDERNWVYPFYYSVSAGRDIPNRSLIGAVSYTRNAGLLSVGLKLKF